MAMNATRLTLNVKGVNKTGKVFKEIALSAGHVAKDVALIGGAAIAGATAAFALAAKSLGRLSDVAMQSGTSAEEITKLSTALNVLGIKSQTPEQLATAFQKMAKSIGETGMGGFKRTIQSIAELATVEERSSAAMAVFGRSGLDFMPLIEAAARNGIDSLNAVIDAMPGISDSAANAGDAVADAMVLMTSGAKSLWMNAVGEVCKLLDSQFAGGVREAAMKGNAYMEYFVKVTMRYVTTWFTSWSQATGGIREGFRVALNNMLKLGGEFVKAFFESVASPLRKVFELVADSWVNLWIRITEGEAAAVEHSKLVWQAWNKPISELAAEPWEKLADTVRGMQWFPDGTEIKLDDLRVNLEKQLAEAGKAAAAVGSAAVGFAATDAATDTADKIDTAVRKARNELLLGGSYKAATMSINSEYGKGEKDKVVKSVDRVRSFVEKIASVNGKIASALGDFDAI